VAGVVAGLIIDDVTSRWRIPVAGCAAGAATAVLDPTPTNGEMVGTASAAIIVSAPANATKRAR
jgi:hypothetical protein